MKSKIKKELTTNSSQYKKYYHHYILQKEGKCTKCPPNKGCNSKSKRKNDKSWKKYRKNKYKIFN